MEPKISLLLSSCESYEEIIITLHNGTQFKFSWDLKIGTFNGTSHSKTEEIDRSSFGSIYAIIRSIGVRSMLVLRISSKCEDLMKMKKRELGMV